MGLKLNVGCGERKLPGFINIDIEASTKPDLICDLTKDSLPFKSGEVDEIYCLHNIEHIELCFWPHVFTEFRRVLKVEGILILMYPEFEVCSKYFLENYLGLKDFWRNCLYGRQTYPGDYHVTPIVSSELKNHLQHAGFHNVTWASEDAEPQYSIMRGFKIKELITKETLLRDEIFGKSGVK